MQEGRLPFEKIAHDQLLFCLTNPFLHLDFGSSAWGCGLPRSMSSLAVPGAAGGGVSLGGGEEGRGGGEVPRPAWLERCPGEVPRLA